jgi:hypothetical protein
MMRHWNDPLIEIEIASDSVTFARVDIGAGKRPHELSISDQAGVDERW